MALDPDARKIALNFTGGSLVATQGLLEAIFGGDLPGSQEAPPVSPVSVSGHSRTRVIGGSSTSVAGSSYVKKKYPKVLAGGAAAGEPIGLLVNGKYWTARLKGSGQAFNDFLFGGSFTLAQPLYWKSTKGSTYGPFGMAVPGT